MYSAQVVSSGHRDLIHDVAFNWYGTHLATCSSDQDVKVWEWEEEPREWVCRHAWRSHSGAVWKVTWAHPEYGKVLATCSFDRTACIWEEVAGDDPNEEADRRTRQAQEKRQKKQQQQQEPQHQQQNANETVTGAGVPVRKYRTHWVKRQAFVDSRTSVTDVKFAPKHLGLMLATCSQDGIVRIYEASDVMNLTQWALVHEIKNELPCSCLSWNPSINKTHVPMIAVGSDDQSPSNGPKVQVYELSEQQRRWERVEALDSVREAVHDLAFAPASGRSYALLAVASSADLKIVSIKPLWPAAQPYPDAPISEAYKRDGKRYEIKLAGRFTDHGSTVWRVCWNVTATVLASSGDDGRVRMWKSNYRDNWKCVATLRSENDYEKQQQQQQQQQQPGALANTLTAYGGFGGGGGGSGFGGGGGGFGGGGLPPQRFMS